MLNVVTLVEDNLLVSVTLAVTVLALVFLLVLRGHPIELGPIKIGARSPAELQTTSATKSAYPGSAHTARHPQSRTIVASAQEAALRLSLLPSGDLGYGIQLGGKHEGFALRIAACDWEEHVSGDQVRSGWLYTNNNAGPYLAVAFFKVHLSPDGSGYIHICDAASPLHTIWFKAHRDYRKQDFHCIAIGGIVDAISSATWSFRWKDDDAL